MTYSAASLDSGRPNSSMFSQNPRGDWMTVIEDCQGKCLSWELVVWQVWNCYHSDLISIFPTCQDLPSCETFMKLEIPRQWVSSEVLHRSSQSPGYVSMSEPWPTLWALLTLRHNTIAKYDTYDLERWLQGVGLRLRLGNLPALKIELVLCALGFIYHVFFYLVSLPALSALEDGHCSYCSNSYNPACLSPSHALPQLLAWLAGSHLHLLPSCQWRAHLYIT